jgi:hypothetical protein
MEGCCVLRTGTSGGLLRIEQWNFASMNRSNTLSVSSASYTVASCNFLLRYANPTDVKFYVRPYFWRILITNQYSHDLSYGGIPEPKCRAGAALDCLVLQSEVQWCYMRCTNTNVKAGVVLMSELVSLCPCDCREGPHCRLTAFWNRIFNRNRRILIVNWKTWVKITVQM